MKKPANGKQEKKTMSCIRRVGLFHKQNMLDTTQSKRLQWAGPNLAKSKFTITRDNGREPGRKEIPLDPLRILNINNCSQTFLFLLVGLSCCNTEQKSVVFP